MKRQCPSKRLVIGITGVFGSGKSTVAQIIKGWKAKLIDADAISHNLLNKDKKVKGEIARVFPEVFNKDRIINRQRLADLVFKNSSSRKKLEKIMHPRIIKQIKKSINKIKSGLVILDAPLLFETKLNNLCDYVIVVKANQKQIFERVKKRFCLSKGDIRARISAQIPLRKKIAQADFIIDNSGSKLHLINQLNKLRRMLWRS
ncbi:MAG: dephospho-CoA kinase [Candidatus Omnitrophica bacterium]|nr:dephospho-CoA kinase [Candidatus Omnitrophota bacterium]